MKGEKERMKDSEGGGVKDDHTDIESVSQSDREGNVFTFWSLI